MVDFASGLKRCADRPERADQGIDVVGAVEQGGGYAHAGTARWAVALHGEDAMLVEQAFGDRGIGAGACVAGVAERGYSTVQARVGGRQNFQPGRTP